MRWLIQKYEIGDADLVTVAEYATKEEAIAAVALLSFPTVAVVIVIGVD